jgi:hypothetical protein
VAVPAPSRDQVVAALMHFGAIQQKLDTILADPDLGKSDMRGPIREGILDLVADRIMPASTAVSTLISVPDGSIQGGPLAQRKWIEQHDAQTRQARDLMLEHYRMENPGIAGAVTAAPPTKYDRNKHTQHVQSLISHYRGPKHG